MFVVQKRKLNRWINKSNQHQNVKISELWKKNKSLLQTNVNDWLTNKPKQVILQWSSGKKNVKDQMENVSVFVSSKDVNYESRTPAACRSQICESRTRWIHFNIIIILLYVNGSDVVCDERWKDRTIYPQDAQGLVLGTRLKLGHNIKAVFFCDAAHLKHTQIPAAHRSSLWLCVIVTVKDPSCRLHERTSRWHSHLCQSFTCFLQWMQQGMLGHYIITFVSDY